ncbi:hypothetical protein Rsub_01591 [Raphidocelis subcapitata]|uniref:3-hydroxyisobutyryl-CoA hydrolase n=1 Tax=Raphidocelis subcapitata TaxID=307507 RepID=A0A2V0NQ37_9CHLO|nr:hypothetical protein Rsub_01591 [Raphidocelis subcapitata]|eukprot:GBF88692.1 hypothetical protein Rsub_01591 [Raphidocelis subcapitata]
MTAGAADGADPGPAAGVRLRLYRGGGGAALGRITLCRDRQLNALDLAAVEEVRRHLLDCCSGPHAGVAAVLLDSSTPRAFCAGGDVKSARAAVLEAPYLDAPPAGHHIHGVFQAEYQTVVVVDELSRRLPVVALCDGIWMGLGFGLAGYARHRVVTEATVFAMPENLIGLWPDVGFAWRAARLASPSLGIYLALTGARVASASDLMWLGVATHYCHSSKVAALREAVEAAPAEADAAVAAHCSDPGGPGPLRRCAAAVERCFGPLLRYSEAGQTEAGALQQLMARIEAELASPGADDESRDLLRAALDSMRAVSPGSLAITLRHFSLVAAAAAEAGAADGSRGAGAAAGGGGGGSGEGGGGGLSTLRGVMAAEYRMAVRRVAAPDFLEGVRALLVDKDRSPAWRPASLEGLEASEAAGVAAPLPAARGVAGLELGEVDAALAALDARGRAAAAAAASAAAAAASRAV